MNINDLKIGDLIKYKTPDKSAKKGYVLTTSHIKEILPGHVIVAGDSLTGSVYYVLYENIISKLEGIGTSPFLFEWKETPIEKEVNFWGRINRVQYCNWSVPKSSCHYPRPLVIKISDLKVGDWVKVIGLQGMHCIKKIDNDGFFQLQTQFNGLISVFKDQIICKLVPLYKNSSPDGYKEIPIEQNKPCDYKLSSCCLCDNKEWNYEYGHKYHCKECLKSVVNPETTYHCPKCDKKLWGTSGMPIKEYVKEPCADCKTTIAKSVKIDDLKIGDIVSYRTNENHIVARYRIRDVTHKKLKLTCVGGAEEYYIPIWIRKEQVVSKFIEIPVIN